MERFGLRWSAAPRPPLSASRGFALAQVANLDSGFLQIPHWLPCGSGLAVLLVLKVRRGVSSGTLAFAYMFPAPRAMAGFAPASRLTCRSHAVRAAPDRAGGDERPDVGVRL